MQTGSSSDALPAVSSSFSTTSSSSTSSSSSLSFDLFAIPSLSLVLLSLIGLILLSILLLILYRFCCETISNSGDYSSTTDYSCLLQTSLCCPTTSKRSPFERLDSAYDEQDGEKQKMLRSSPSPTKTSSTIFEQQPDNSQAAKRQAARAGWAQRRETFTRHSYERPLLIESMQPLFDADRLRLTSQQPPLKANQIMHFPPSPSPPSTPCSPSTALFLSDGSTVSNELIKRSNGGNILLQQRCDLFATDNCNNNHDHNQNDSKNHQQTPQISLPAPISPTSTIPSKNSRNNPLLLRPQLAHQSSSSSSSSPADLQSLAEKGRIGRQRRPKATTSAVPALPVRPQANSNSTPSPTPSIVADVDASNESKMMPRFTLDSPNCLTDFVEEVHPVRSFSRFTLQGFSRGSSPISMEPRPSSQPVRLPLLNVNGSDGSNLSSRSHSASSSSSMSSCCECNDDSDEQSSRPFLRSHHQHHHHHHHRSNRMAFHPQLIATCRSPPSSPESVRSNSVAASFHSQLQTTTTPTTTMTDQNSRSRSTRPPRPCRSFLCLLDSPLLSNDRNGRPLLSRSPATVGNRCSIDSSSDGEWSEEPFFHPQLGHSSQERLSSRSSLDQISQLSPSTPTNKITATPNTTTAVKRVLGRRQTVTGRKLTSAQRLLLETSAEPSFEIDSEVEHAYRPLSSFERSVDSNDVMPELPKNHPQQQQLLIGNVGTTVERSHTVGANLRSMARSIGRFVGAENITFDNNNTHVGLNRSLDRSSTFDSLRSLEGHVAGHATTAGGNEKSSSAASTASNGDNRTKLSVNGGLQRIRSLNPIRALRPMRSLNPLRTLGAMRTIGRMRSLSAAELREEREDQINSSHVQTKFLLQPQRLLGNELTKKSVANSALTTTTTTDARGFIDISIAFDQAARKLLLGVQKVHLKWLQEEAQLQVKMVLLPGRRRKCKTKTRPCVNGYSEFNQQFTWNRIRPEDIPYCAIKYTVEMISCSNIVIGTQQQPLNNANGNELANVPSGAGKRRFLGEQLLSFVECRPQLQQRCLTLQLDQICSHICGDAFDSCSPLCNDSQTNSSSRRTQPSSSATALTERRMNAYGRLAITSATTAAAAATAATVVGNNKALFVPGLLQINGSNGAFGGSLDASRPELLLGLAYNATTGRLQVNVLRGSQLHVRCAQKPPHSYVKCTLLSCTGQELARGKTSVRRAQPNPLFKQTFAFQVTLFQLPDVSLVVTVYNRKSMNRKEMIGWFSLGCNSSGEEEHSHWNEMRDSKGEQICRWHVLGY